MRFRTPCGGKLQAMAVLLCVFCAVAVSWKLYTHEKEYVQREFDILASESEQALRTRLEQYRVAIDGLGGMISVVGTPSRADVRTYVQSLNIADSLPGINGIGYIEPVTQADQMAYEAQARADGMPDFSVKPVSDRDPMFVIRFVEPYEGNEQAYGLDIAFEEGRRTAAIAARDSGEAQLTRRILLVQDETKQSGFLLLVPHYEMDDAIDTIEARRAAFRGWVYAPFVGARTLQDLTVAQENSFDLWVFDGEATDENLIYTTQTAQDAAHTPKYTTTADLEVFGQTWTLGWASRSQFETSRGISPHWIFLGLGLLFSALLAKLFNIQTRRENTVRKKVDERTHELAAQIKQNESILNNPIFGITIADSIGQVVRANEAAHNLLDMIAEADSTGLGTLSDDFVSMQDGTRRQIECEGPSGPMILSIKKNVWTTPDDVTMATYFLRDITVEESAATKLAETEERMNTALEASEIAVFEVNLVTGVSIVSDIWKRIMGVADAPEDFDTQAYLLSRIDPDDLGCLQANDRACIDGLTDRSLTEFRVHLDSGMRWMRSTAFVSKRDASGKALRLIGTQSDITELKEMDQIKNEFIANVSHELRTPITSMKGAIALLQHSVGDTLPASTKHLLTIAHTNVERLTVLVNDILDIQRIQTGNMPFQIEPTNIAELIREARDQMIPYARSHSISLRIGFCPQEQELNLDRVRFLQILTNYLSNACKFAPAGSTVEIGTEYEANSMKIFVRDQGAGVPDWFLNSLFKRFAQADSSDARNNTGTGLGLSITREIAEHMNGTVGYRRTPEGETEFWVSFPRISHLIDAAGDRTLAG